MNSLEIDLMRAIAGPIIGSEFMVHSGSAVASAPPDVDPSATLFEGLPRLEVTYFDPEKLVAYLSRVFLIEVTPKTLANWRSLGIGPRWVKVGARVRYQAIDVARWQAALKKGGR